MPGDDYIEDYMVQIHFPTGLLQQYILNVVYSEFYAAHSVDRLVPDGTVNLIFEFSDHPQYVFDNQDLQKKTAFHRVWISGMHLDYLSISAGNGAGMMVVQFTALGARSILHLPISELNNRVVPAELVLGQEILDLRSKLQESTYGQKITHLETWLEARLQIDPMAHAVVAHVVEETERNPSLNNLTQLIAQTGYSHRHFNEIFKQYLGFTPKQYQRIIRFNQVLQLMAQRKPLDWSSVAFQCGYYDQAHFIKEFKRFSGFNPSAYAAERSDFINYVAIS